MFQKFVTPLFFCLVSLSCVLFGKLHREHLYRLTHFQEERQAELVIGLDEQTKLYLKEVIDLFTHSSGFRLMFSAKYTKALNTLSDHHIRGLDLLAFLILDEDATNSLQLVKHQKRQYNQFLEVLKDALVREYEGAFFFERARRFADCLGIEQEAVIKVLQEMIAESKYEKDPLSIQAVIDFLLSKRHFFSSSSFSLL